MSELVERLNAAAAVWAERAGAVLWQSLLLAALVTIVCQFLRRANPAVRYWLWQVVVVKLLLLPLWVVSLTLPTWWIAAPAAAPPTTSANALATDGPSPTDALLKLTPGTTPEATAAPSTPPPLWFTRLTWQAWLLLAWSAGVLWQVVRLVVQRYLLAVLLRQADDAIDPNLAALVRDLANRLGLRHAPRIAIADYRGSPFVCGLVRPVLVLPKPLLDTLDVGRLRLVILHELAHVRRRDLLWGWLPEIARVLYFFHPVAYFARYQVRLERELACDQLALQLGGSRPADYADTLLAVIGYATPFNTLKESRA